MIPLTILSNDNESRVTRDRLELMTALINAPAFDPLYRSDIIEFPPDHPVYAWQCLLDDCTRIRRLDNVLCSTHRDQWLAAQDVGTSRAEFLSTATPLEAGQGIEILPCVICVHVPADSPKTQLCRRHHGRWSRFSAKYPDTDFSNWCANETAQPSYGVCVCVACTNLAYTPLGLCELHQYRYRNQGSPGGAALDRFWQRSYQAKGLPIPITYADKKSFRKWCVTADPVYRIGVLNLLGVAPLAKAEIQWGLYSHAQLAVRSQWDITRLQRIANNCRQKALSSLADLAANNYAALLSEGIHKSQAKMICLEIVERLRTVYHSPSDTKDAGFIETDHFGFRFPSSRSTFDLTGVSQRWLRDLLWDHLAELLRSTDCPRTRGTFDTLRRGCTELSAYLELYGPEGGHRPELLAEEHAKQFAADLRNRADNGLPSLGQTRVDGKPSTVTIVTRRLVLNHARKILYRALESGRAAQIGLDPAFIAAVPSAGHDPKRSRNPFSDDVARALADENNLQVLADTYDPFDRGLRDIWEAIIVTGRRSNEIIQLRLDCIGRYSGLPMLWHDQTKVGNYNEGIRIPEPLYQRIDQRRIKSIARFESRQGRLPTPAERATIALFPSNIRNPNETQSLSYGHFSRSFKAWVDELNLPTTVAHQARHTLATNLLRAGASLAHIRRYLGQVSDRMAEHYAKIANSDLEDLLQTVWVAGPGAPTPGELLAGGTEPMKREEALALALDLSRRSTPADGGFCTFQPVVDGSACPWNLDCENCENFVMSGADLLYWRRKQEQWQSIAERAPDSSTADYLHEIFEPTARAIAGLEKALAAIGLLDEALKLDLRRPQDYFHRIWSTNFRTADLAQIEQPNTDDPDNGQEQPA